MAAAIVLPPLLQVVIDKLASPLLQKLSDHFDLKLNLHKLQQTLPMVQAILENAEEHQLTDEVVRIWLSQLKDAADKAEDVLEEFIVKEAMSAEGPSHISMHAHVSAEKVRKVLALLQTAASEGLQTLGLRFSRKSDADSEIKKRVTGSYSFEPEVYGRDEDVKQLRELLLAIPTGVGRTNVSIIPIVGIGGIGKTTLAQATYADKEVMECFDMRVWVYVSANFDARKILKAVIESATRERCDLSEMDVIQSQLWDTLCNKRYLLVLDDVWIEDEDEWEKLGPLLHGGVNGSKIMVTTRSKKVAMAINPHHNFTHYLKGLSEEACWALFKKRAFCQGDEEKHLYLPVIGKRLVKKCGGVPLAAKTLGSLMRFKRDEHEWLFVENSELWDLEACQKTGILPALMLSYLHLPSRLKHCFTFCSVFPKNYEIKKDKLILIWMAENLILPREGDKRPEDIGADYFNELSWMSFFEEIKVKDCDPDTITGYKIHDLFYDLARSITRNENMVVDSVFPHRSFLRVKGAQMAQIRHFTSDSRFLRDAMYSKLLPAEHLRTILLLPSRVDGSKNVLPDMFSNFRYLRVLDVSGSDIRLPYNIRDLQCLKFLDVSNTDIDQLTPGVSSLWCLQTLNLSGCYNLKSLPSLSKMKGLRHLNLAGCEKLTEMPHGIEGLVHLQTLPIYIPSQQFSLRALGSLNLRGELKVKHLENVTHVKEAKEANLMSKEHIQALGLCWGHDGSKLCINPISDTLAARFPMKKGHEPQPSGTSTTDSAIDSILAGEVLGSLQPHQNLKRLYVSGYPGFKFPEWMLPNLTTLVLMNCRECLHLPTLGHLPVLKTLHMEGMDKVVGIGLEFYGKESQTSFPVLEELIVNDFPILKEWCGMDGRSRFPRLSKLTMRKCPSLVEMPVFPSLIHLELHSCNPSIFDAVKRSTSLSTLVIKEFPELLSLPRELLGNSSLLFSLKIFSCQKLISLPFELQNLSSLKILALRWCKSLSLPKGFRSLTGLESLEITECDNITSLPEEEIAGLKSLKVLSIENCSNLVSISMGIQHLTALEQLTIMYCPNLASLPDGFQYLSALKGLIIISCSELEFLPDSLQHASGLQSLEIRSCPKLSSLPEWSDSFLSLRSLAISDCRNMSSLPVALSRLTTLQHLSIHQCPDLETRCHQEKGADWWKIAHIPHKYISSSEHGQHSSTGSTSTS